MDKCVNVLTSVSMQATSDELRAQGNDKYTSIQDGLPPTIFANRLQASIDLYNKVLSPELLILDITGLHHSLCAFFMGSPGTHLMFVRLRRSVGALPIAAKFTIVSEIFCAWIAHQSCSYMGGTHTAWTDKGLADTFMEFTRQHVPDRFKRPFSRGLSLTR